MATKDAIQDDITFMLASERTIVNDTVKMVASISGMVTSDMTETNLQERIREMMKNFIPDALWSFSNITRSTNASGMEQIDLEASARVSEKENYSLDKRTRAVSTEGLSITHINADTTPPMYMIEENESALRVDLLKKANTELQIINKTMESVYRVGSVMFQPPVTNDYSNTRMLSAKTAMASSYGSGWSSMGPQGPSGSSEPDTLGNAVKLIMRANVTYRRNAI